MVGGDQEGAAHAVGGFHQAADAMVDRGDRLGGGLHLAGVPHHVRVGVVDHDQGVDALSNRSNTAFGELVGGHGRRLVVGGDPGGGHQMAVFAGEGFFDATVEKVGDVGVLLGFGGAELAQAMAGHHLAQQAIEGFRRERHLDGQAALVLGEGHHMQGADLDPLEGFEFGHHQGPDQLPHPVGAEVETDHAVIGLEVARSQAGGFDEFIGHAFGIGGLHHLQGRQSTGAVVLAE